MKSKISEGVVHKMPDDLKEALMSDRKVLELWEDITVLARNEFICWVESAKKSKQGHAELGEPKKNFLKENGARVAGRDVPTAIKQYLGATIYTLYC